MTLTDADIAAGLAEDDLTRLGQALILKSDDPIVSLPALAS